MEANFKPANFLLIAVSAMLFICGAILGLTLRAAGVNTWSRFSALASEAVFGAPIQDIRFAFDRELLGEPSLRSRSNAGLPSPLIANASLELLNDFAPNSRYRELVKNSGVLRLDLVVNIGGKEQISPCTAFLVDSDKLLTAGHCLAPVKFKDPIGRTLEGALRAAYYSAASEGVAVSPELQVLEYDEKGLDYAIIGIGNQAAASLMQAGYRSARLSATHHANQDLFVIHHPLGDVLHLSRRNCRLTKSDSASEELEYFEHSCGTLPGTSGAPIFDDRTLTVVGLHVRGDPNVLQLNRTDGSGLSVVALIEASPIIKALVGDELG